MKLRLLTGTALSLQSDGTYEAFSLDAWKYAGEMVLLGMGMIFAVLGLLWVVLAVFKMVFAKKEPKKVQVQTYSMEEKKPKERVKEKA